MNLRLPSHALPLAVLLVPGLSLIGAFALANTVGKASTVPPPASTSAQSLEWDPASAIRHGRSLFVRSCTHCHGEDASGSGEDADGPDLHGLRISNARIRAVVRTGIPGEMPSFVRKHSPADIADLVAYLRSLPVKA